MNWTIYQKALKELGFDPGEVDGKYGPNTARAIRRFQVRNNIRVTGELDERTISLLGRADPADYIDRIILHWTAGTQNVTQLDRKHYHYIVGKDLKFTKGLKEPEDNVVTDDGDYAAHTLRLNTSSAGIAIAGMAGAKESPFDPGKHPFNEEQLDRFCELAARLAYKYKVPVTRETVLTHAEVEPTLGVAQRGKWDIAWLPGMEEPGDPVEVGDKLRERIKGYLKDIRR